MSSELSTVQKLTLAKQRLFECFTLDVVAKIPAITYQKVVEKAKYQVPFASVPAYAYPCIIYLAARDSTFDRCFLSLIILLAQSKM